ncbi:MAG: histidine phosphatase family protein [Methylococcales bacterium]|jgi:phosphohistidine phosphatase|nr:MAG: histidine phosphatase family protein [Methylococcales bacterium]
MSKELCLLRHGKSDRDLAVDDFDRPLKKRGKTAVQRMGEWMQQQHILPDYLVSSPAKRAISTANIAHKALAVEGLDIMQDKRMYQSGLEAIKSVLAECPINAARVLLVGHNPDLEDLLIYLVGASRLPETNKLLPTSSLVRLKMPEDWSTLEPGCAQLLSITYAKSLLDEEI